MSPRVIGKGWYYCGNPRCLDEAEIREIRGSCYDDSYFICFNCGNINRIKLLKKFYNGRTQAQVGIDRRCSLHKTRKS